MKTEKRTALAAAWRIAEDIMARPAMRKIWDGIAPQVREQLLQNWATIIETRMLQKWTPTTVPIEFDTLAAAINAYEPLRGRAHDEERFALHRWMSAAAEALRPTLQRPTFNHTRADGPFAPCPQCLEQMDRASLIALVKDLAASGSRHPLHREQPDEVTIRPAPETEPLTEEQLAAVRELGEPRFMKEPLEDHHLKCPACGAGIQLQIDRRPSAIDNPEIADLDLAVAQLQRVKRELRAAGVFVPDDPNRRLTREQHSLLVENAGLEDQIEKGHFLNVHFRAFSLAWRAWQEHVRQNAVAGSRQVNSPAGAVLDDKER